MINFDIISRIWNVIVESNTFNFVIFLMLFALIFKKIDFKSIIEALQLKIVKVIEEAKANKEEASQKLVQAEKAVENLPQELEVIVADAHSSAKVIGEKILSEAKKQVEDIESNAVKIIEAEEKMIISKLTKNTSRASVEVAKIHIKNVLEQSPALHEKYINDSINELDRLSF